MIKAYTTKKNAPAVESPKLSAYIDKNPRTLEYDKPIRNATIEINSTLYSTTVFNAHLLSVYLCSSVSSIFWTGNKKQATVTSIDKTIARIITDLKPTIGNNNIPINGPIAAAKLVLKP